MVAVGGPLPLAVQGLGLPEGDHGGLLWRPAQGLGVARGGWSGPLGGWQRVVGRGPAPLPGRVAAVGGPAPRGQALRLGLGLRGVHAIGLRPPPVKRSLVIIQKGSGPPAAMPAAWERPAAL